MSNRKLKKREECTTYWEQKLHNTAWYKVRKNLIIKKKLGRSRSFRKLIKKLFELHKGGCI